MEMKVTKLFSVSGTFPLKEWLGVSMLGTPDLGLQIFSAKIDCNYTLVPFKTGFSVLN